MREIRNILADYGRNFHCGGKLVPFSDKMPTIIKVGMPPKIFEDSHHNFWLGSKVLIDFTIEDIFSIIRPYYNVIWNKIYLKTSYWFKNYNRLSLFRPIQTMLIFCNQVPITNQLILKWHLLAPKVSLIS